MPVPAGPTPKLMSCVAIACRYLRLVGAAPAHRAALDLDRDVLRLDVAGRRGAGVGFAPGAGGSRARSSVSLAASSQSCRSSFSVRADRAVGAGDAEDVAAIGDLHAEAQFDLAQVRVEGAGQVGQAFGVGGVERELRGAVGHVA